MRRQWEDCFREETPSRWAGNYASMNAKGEIMMTRRTYQELGEPAAFFLLYDRFNRTIGVRPAHANERGVFPVGPHGSFGGRVIRAYSLCQKKGITLTSSVRFISPEIDEDGILVLDLRNTIPVLRRERGERNGPVGQ